MNVYQKILDMRRKNSKVYYRRLDYGWLHSANSYSLLQSFIIVFDQIKLTVSFIRIALTSRKFEKKINSSSSSSVDMPTKSSRGWYRRRKRSLLSDYVGITALFCLNALFFKSPVFLLTGRHFAKPIASIVSFSNVTQ